MSVTYYSAVRTKDRCKVQRRCDNETRELDARNDLWNHSPTGFEWGYGGSGPAQLALAILADATGDEDLAIELHQTFKWEVVAKLPKEKWELLRGAVIAWAYTHSQESEDAFLARASGQDGKDDSDTAKLILDVAKGISRPELDW